MVDGMRPPSDDGWLADRPALGASTLLGVDLARKCFSRVALVSRLPGAAVGAYANWPHALHHRQCPIGVRCSSERLAATTSHSTRVAAPSPWQAASICASSSVGGWWTWFVFESASANSPAEAARIGTSRLAV